jgi:di/tricarboxylate transporter
VTWQAWLTAAVLAATIFAMARGLAGPAPAMIGALVVLFGAGVLDPRQAFEGLANPAPITVAALYVMARAVEGTGALQPLVDFSLGRSNTRASLARLLGLSASASAFFNNTAIVAMLISPIVRWSAERSTSPSRLLLPLCFAVTLGGVVTAIGTSTNVLVSGLLEARGMAPFGLFELTPVGLPLAIVGVGLLVLLSPILMKERATPDADLREGAREFVLTMQVIAGGALDGATVEAAGLRNLRGVYLVEIERRDERIAPVSPGSVLRGGDRLTFAGRADLVVDLQAKRGLASTESKHLGGLEDPEHTFFEAVVGEDSRLVGHTLKEIGFRERYQSAVVAIHRAGRRIDAKLGEVQLQPGDTLLLLADPGFRERWRDRSDFLLVARLGGSPPPSAHRALLALAVVGVVVLLAATETMPIVRATVLGATALIVLRIVSFEQARGAVDMETILVIAASFGLGTAIETSGLAAKLAGAIHEGLGAFGPRGVLIGIVVATVALTELLSNNAAAALMLPIALAAATAIGADPRSFAIATTIAASISFLTPIGYQTNMMVYGPGGYTLADYLRLGAPLSVTSVLLLALLA